MVTGRSFLIDITLQLHHETDRAILVSDTEDKDDAVWLPKSQIEIERKAKGVVEVTAPEWLLLDKGLL